MEQSFRGMIMNNFLLKLLRDTRGATAIEYGLIIALVCLSLIAAMTQLGETNKSTFEIVSTKMSAN